MLHSACEQMICVGGKGLNVLCGSLIPSKTLGFRMQPLFKWPWRPDTLTPVFSSVLKWQSHETKVPARVTFVWKCLSIRGEITLVRWYKIIASSFSILQWCFRWMFLSCSVLNTAAAMTAHCCQSDFYVMIVFSIWETPTEYDLWSNMKLFNNCWHCLNA